MAKKNKKIDGVEAVDADESIDNTDNGVSNTGVKQSRPYILILSVIFVLFVIILVFFKINPIKKFLSLKEDNRLQIQNKVDTTNAINTNSVTNNDSNMNNIVESYRVTDEYYYEKFSQISKTIEDMDKTIQRNSHNIISLEEKARTLEKKLEEAIINPQRIELIKIALNIQDRIAAGENYSNSLGLLRTLSLNNDFLAEKIAILDKYSDMNLNEIIIQDDFTAELNSFISDHNLLKNSNNQLSKFLSNFMVIRKIKNVEPNSVESFMVSLERDMLVKNYRSALKSIEQNGEYEKYFKKTVLNLRALNLLNSTSADIVDYLVNG